jgi:hypothetical protein
MMTEGHYNPRALQPQGVAIRWHVDPEAWRPGGNDDIAGSWGDRMAYVNANGTRS